jgi:hypothetical protein
MKSTDGEQDDSKENKTSWYQYVTVWAAVTAGVGAALAAGSVRIRHISFDRITL